jgi:drug/metabolite transporter (DMT)-like permease
MPFIDKISSHDGSVNTSIALLFLLMAGVLWSFGGVLIKWVSWNPLAIAGMRSAISVVVLVLYLRKPRFTWSFAQFGGAFSYTATVILFVSANKLTTAANAILLQYTAPVFTALFSGWFLKERTVWYDWLAIIVVIAGMALFFFDDLSVGGYLGNILAIISGVTLGWLSLFLRKQKAESPLESVLLGNVFTAFICLPFMFGSAPSLHGWFGLILLGIFQLGFSYILFSLAIRSVPALDAILICTIEPVLNPLWVFLFLKEVPGPWSLLGGGIVLLTIILRSVYRSGTRVQDTIKRV